jgi:large subunit ribosomal protein L2
MSVKEMKPTTSGQRGTSYVAFRKYITKREPEKRLTEHLKKAPGRDSLGHISVRHKGGGVKRLYRKVDFKQTRSDQPAKVLAIEYDPYRTAFLALLEYGDGVRSYMIAPEGLKVGDTVVAAPKTDLKLGNRMQLVNIPSGIEIHNVELTPGRGGQLVRSAGTSATLTGLEENGRYAQVKMPSGEVRRILATNYASIGRVSNVAHSAQTIGKAGRTRHMGIRPSVRGKAMYPAAHPHGGGEGLSPVGLKHPKTPWGKPARGVRTRRRKHTDQFIVQRRKK